MAMVCVDCMGSDEPPEVVVEGCVRALRDDPEIEILLAGDERYVVPFAEAHDRGHALVCTEVIAMDEHSTQAVRRKRDSSIVRGCMAVREGEADAFFSPGSTGAILAAATLRVGRLKGVIRPALAAVVPGLDGRARVFLDLGANADVRTEMLVQFALMGTVMARKELGIAHPRCALLSNGTEDTKGSERSLEAFAALKDVESIDFAGHCEGSDILLGDADVIVTDGFTGNIALKSMEGTAKYLAKRLKAAARRNLLCALGALAIKGEFATIASDLSGDEHGGAILLGVRAPVLVGHGATSVSAVEHGALVAQEAVKSQLAEDIEAALA